MEILALGVLVFFSIIGLAAVFVNFYGTILIFFGAFLYAWLTRFSSVTPGTLFILFGLLLFGEALDYVLMIAGIRRTGASKRSVLGALAGGAIGAMLGALFFGIGFVPGSFIGIFLGIVLVEFAIRRDIGHSLKAGTGGLLGMLGAVAVKFLLALIMIGILAWKIAGGS